MHQCSLLIFNYSGDTSNLDKDEPPFNISHDEISLSSSTDEGIVKNNSLYIVNESHLVCNNLRVLAHRSA